MDEGPLYSVVTATIAGVLGTQIRRWRTRRARSKRPASEARQRRLSGPMKPISELRKSTGASFVDCRKALDATGHDLSAARDWLHNRGVKQVLASTHCDREDAEAGFSKYGWNLEQATNHARQRWLHRNPEEATSSAASVRRKRLDVAESLADVLVALDSSDEPEMIKLVEVLEEYESAAAGCSDALFGEPLFEAAASALELLSAAELAGELRRAAACEDPGMAFDESHFRRFQADLVARVVSHLGSPAAPANGG